MHKLLYAVCFVVAQIELTNKKTVHVQISETNLKIYSYFTALSIQYVCYRDKMKLQVSYKSQCISFKEKC